jgi:SAM-dependent methyltransferase
VDDPGTQGDWWRKAFRRRYLELYAHRDLAAARAEVAFLAAEGLVAGRVLDLCCGQGRHALAMAERGVDVRGLDWSQELLDRAGELDQAGLLRGRLSQGDARALPFAAGEFDGVVQLFTSFGYFDRQGDLTVAAEVARVLRPGGAWTLDLANPDLLRRALVPHSTREHAGARIEERRELLEGGSVVRKHVRWIEPSGVEDAWTERVRLWTADDLEAPLRALGLRLERRLGGFAGEPFGPEAPRQILVWRRDPGR